MPVDLPRSHIDTPAWQSFELRMRARAAERRDARRRKRLRRLRYSTIGLFALGLGFASAFAYRTLDESNSLERAVIHQPLVLEWPPLPSAPEPVIAGGLVALSVPGNAIEPIGGEPGSVPGTGGEPASEPQTVATVAIQPAPVPALPTGETPDDVSFRAPPRATRTTTPPASPVNSVAATTPSRSPASRNPDEAQKATSAERMVEPPVGTSSRNPGRNLSPEPPVGTSSRNLSPEPPVGTSSRNLLAEPSVGTNRLPSEARSAKEGRNPLAEPASEEPIRAVLDRYRNAYQQLDASAARSVWPGVNVGALSRAFGALSSQQISFDGCAIAVSGDSADATCNGQSRIIPKIGGGSETARRTWVFRLKQSGADWIIEKATVK